MEAEASLVYAEQMTALSDLSVVLSNVRNPMEVPIAVTARFSLLVQAAPQWFGLRGERALAASDISVQVGERGVDAALASGLVALAPRAARLPPRDTAQTYLTWAAVLAGAAGTVTKQLAERFRIEAHLNKPLQSAPPHVRRAVGVAAAFLSGATVLVLEDPLDGLPLDVAEEFTRVLSVALVDRRVLWLAPRVSPGSALAEACGEALWFAGAACVYRRRAEDLGSLAESDACVLSLRGPAEAFTERLSADGVEHARIASAVSGDSSTTTWKVHTRETWRVFSAAADVGATITELRPLASTFG